MLYVGTYSRRGSEGLYALDFEADTGALRVIAPLANLHNPSFLALRPRGGCLYSVCEGEPEGAVAALVLSGARASVLNQQSTLGAGPCHVAIDPTGRWVVAANYGSGSVTLFPVLPDGHLAPACDHHQHQGTGPVTSRQAGPHAHSATFDPRGRFLIAADLGTDRLLIYRLEADEGKLVPHDPPEVVVAPGAGPRHFAFHPTGPWAYLINELDNTVIAYRWDGAAGTLTPLQTLSTLPPDFDGTSYCADIHVHPSGRFLYGTNRGHDSLAVFAVDPGTGLLTVLGHVPTGGEHPRNFALSPDGCWLLVANQDSDNLVVFAVSEDGARLTPTGQVLSLPAPTCVLFAG